MTQQPFETIMVHTHKIACDGGAAPSNHPRVFLHLDDDTHQVTCPYCSRLYVLDEAVAAAAGH